MTFPTVVTKGRSNTGMPNPLPKGTVALSFATLPNWMTAIVTAPPTLSSKSSRQATAASRCVTNLNSTKRQGYLNTGLFHPLKKTIQVWKLNEQGYYIGLPPVVEGDLLGTSIVPNLEVNVTEVFEDWPLYHYVLSKSSCRFQEKVTTFAKRQKAMNEIGFLMLKLFFLIKNTYFYFASSLLMSQTVSHLPLRFSQTAMYLPV